MQVGNGSRAEAHRQYVRYNRVDWLIIAFVSNGLSVGLTLLVIMFLLRR